MAPWHWLQLQFQMSARKPQNVAEHRPIIKVRAMSGNRLLIPKTPYPGSLCSAWQIILSKFYLLQSDRRIRLDESWASVAAPEV